MCWSLDGIRTRCAEGGVNDVNIKANLELNVACIDVDCGTGDINNWTSFVMSAVRVHVGNEIIIILSSP